MSSRSNYNYRNSNEIVTIGAYKINRRQAMLKSNATALDFLNPAEDFIGVVECLGNIRHIEKKGEMRQDLDVIDCKVTAVETREVEVESVDGILKRREVRQYNNEAYSLVLTKTVLLNRFKKLQEEQDLTGKRIVIVGLGKQDKNYYDYYIAMEEKARQDGVLPAVEQIK